MQLTKNHVKWASRVKDLRDLEHFRVPADKINDEVWDLIQEDQHRMDMNPRSDVHIALVITGDAAYVGYSRCSALDQYNAKRGYAIAVGRALRHAGQKDRNYMVNIDKGLEGRALRDACRAALNLPLKYPQAE